MTNNTFDNRVGRVLRASTRGFDCGTHSKHISAVHDFGAFVKAPIANDRQTFAVGIIYKVEIKDDQLISELVLGEAVPDMVLRDQRENRMIPVEIKVLNAGFVMNNQIIHSLPPRPPMSLSDVEACTADEIRDFTAHAGFFRLILGASEVPADDLIAAAIWQASDARPQEERYNFHVQAGQEIARLISNDLKRLSHILNLIRPGY